AVEPAFALGALVAVRADGRVERRSQRGLCAGPGRIVTDAALRRPSEPELEPQPECPVDALGQPQQAHYLILDLLGRQEDVRVVLSQGLQTQHSREDAGALVAVEQVIAGQPKWQLAVTAAARAEDHHRAWTVDRLEPEATAFSPVGEEHALFVMG